MCLNLQFLINFSEESSFLLPTCSYSITGFKRMLQSTRVTIWVRGLQFLVRLRWVLRVTPSHTFPFSSIASLNLHGFPSLCKLVQCFPANVLLSWYNFWSSFTFSHLGYCAQCLCAPIWRAGQEAQAKELKVKHQPCQYSLAWKIRTTLFHISWSLVKIKTWTRIPDKTWTRKKQS